MSSKINFLQYDDIQTFKEDGLLNQNDDTSTAQLMVLANGY